MQEGHDTDQPDQTQKPVPIEPTGHTGVDQALATLDGLDERAVHEHVEVFEQAHAALRRALDEAADEPADPQA